MGNSAQNRTPEGMMSDILGRLGRLEGRLPKGLPARLTPEGQQVTDWNDAVEVGYYWSAPGAVNAPYSDYFTGHVLVNPQGQRLIQRISGPFGNPAGDAEWVRARSVTTWFGWRRSDGKIVSANVVAATRNYGWGRYDLNVNANSWFFPGVLSFSTYRAYRITFQTMSETLHRPLFRYLSSGTTQVSTADYLSSDWDQTGHTTATSTVFYTAKTTALSHAGEFVITDPTYTAGATNVKRAYGHTYSAPGSQTVWGGHLQNYNTASMEGFVFFLSDSAMSAPDPGGWLQIQGLL